MKKIFLSILFLLPSVLFAQTDIGTWVVYHSYPGNTPYNNGIERMPFWTATTVHNDTINGYIFSDPQYFFTSMQYGLGLKKCDSIDDNVDVECWSTIDQNQAWHPFDDFSRFKILNNLNDELNDKSAVDKGTATFSGVALTTQYTVTHGLGYTPTSILIQPKSSDAAAVCFTDNYTSSTFRITFITVPNIGTNNITFDWFSLR